MGLDLEERIKQLEVENMILCEENAVFVAKERMAGYCLFCEVTLDNEDCPGLETCPNKNEIENLELRIEDGRKKIKCLKEPLEENPSAKNLAYRKHYKSNATWIDRWVLENPYPQQIEML
jgi:hypothetical protein|tara:strand:- start:1421 stop:1780 length:360 start_codon:yes stop_codon:yes gene_type:complete